MEDTVRYLSGLVERAGKVSDHMFFSVLDLLTRRNTTRHIVDMSNAHGSKWIRPAKRAAIYARDHHVCAYCGSCESLTLDHLTPRELGGGNEAENLVTACLHCNSARRSLSMRAWLQVLRDEGVDTSGLAARIRRQTSKKLASSK